MQPGRWEFQKLSRQCLWAARAERLCSQGVSSGSVRAVGLSAAGTHTCWPLPIHLRQAFRSLLLDGGLSGRGLASGTSHSHTWHQAPRRVSLCQCHAKPSEGGHPGHRLLGFPSAARASLWCFLKPRGELWPSRRPVSQDSTVFTGPWAELPEDLWTHPGVFSPCVSWQ